MRLAVTPAATGLGSRYLNLTRELAITNFKLRYTGSVLGYLWSLMKPAMYFGVLYTIFVGVFHQRGGSFPLQLLVAIVLFTFFAESTTNAVGSLGGNANLIRKATFPLSTLVVSQSLTAFMTLAINMSLIVAVAGPFGKLHLGWESLAIFPLLVELYLLVLGLGMLLASLYIFFHDVGHLWEVLTQFMLWGAGVVFPFSAVPRHWWPVFFANPMAQIIEDARHALVTPLAPWTATLIGWEVLVPIGLSVIAFVAGLICFRRLAPNIAESL